MKVLVLTNLYPPHQIGGYEIRCRDIMERLAARGHEVRILTSDHFIPGREPLDPPHVARDLRIHGFYDHPWLSIPRLFLLEAHNHRVLQREIDSFQPDVVHVWNMGGISKSLLHRLEASPIPVVYDISDHWVARLDADVWLSWWNRPGSRIREISRRALALTGLRRVIGRFAPTSSTRELRFAKIYFCSAFMRDYTASQGWPVGHAAVIHCGIDTSSFSVRKQHSGFGKLLWVGRLSEDKDPLTAIRALAAAHANGLSHLTLDLFGKGDPDYVTKIESEIAALGFQSGVRLLSASAAEMREIYSRYDALLFTSNWGEPFALTPLEAMASGLPVITSLDGGQPELANDGVNSLVATANVPGTYASCLARLDASPELRESIARHALVEVRERFDLEPIVTQVEAFLISAKRGKC